MTRTAALRLALVLGTLIAASAVAFAGVPVLSFLAKASLFAAALAALFWLLGKAYQSFLWRVSRRLAFSYFLIGVVPIPMVLLLALGTAYVLATFFLGHLYRDAMEGFQYEQGERAEELLQVFVAHGRPATATQDDFAFDYYQDGRRVGGAGVGPEAFPAWLTAAPASLEDGGQGGEDAAAGRGIARCVAGADGQPTLALAVEEGGHAITAVFTGDLAAALRKRSGIWVELVPRGEEAGGSDVVVLGHRRLRFQDPGDREGASPELAAERKAFLANNSGEGFWSQVRIHWPQLAGPLHALDTGEVVSREVTARVLATPPQLTRQLYSASSEQDAVLWLALSSVALGLSFFYAAAVIIALLMIFGLSRAVNRLSQATSAVQQGSFAVRIPVRRRDQIGALQSSFNEMAANLEGLVATATQKEVLEKELDIARELQESLLPENLPQGEAVEFATLFEPSAAIGGDYFDILRLDDRRLAVVIADVSGHGLSSGLRMAMIKAALLILIDEEEEPAAILKRLDTLIRGSGKQRFFVTATLAVVDLRAGRLEITNAGHPPTYLLRRGEVREIALPSSPLGSLGHSYATETLELADGDVLIWLSDGFIEAPNGSGEPFGYDRVVDALAGPAEGVAEVRQRLVQAVEAHAAGTRNTDDCTLVVMSYRAPAEAATPPSP